MARIIHTRNCLYCNTLFTLFCRTSTTRFCSSKCYGRYNSENPNVLQPQQIKTRVLKKCLHCNNEYEVHAHRAKGSRFCCKDCQTEYGRSHLACPSCNKLFTIQKHKKTKHCSLECARLDTYNKSATELEIILFLLKEGFAKEKKSLNLSNKRVHPDFIYKNKVIEYYGDYWHCHETMFPDENTFNRSIKMTAKEKRQVDQLRIDSIIQAGYQVLIIREHEFIENKERELEKCLQFLRS